MKVEEITKSLTSKKELYYEFAQKGATVKIYDYIKRYRDIYKKETYAQGYTSEPPSKFHRQFFMLGELIGECGEAVRDNKVLFPHGHSIINEETYEHRNKIFDLRDFIFKFKDDKANFFQNNIFNNKGDENKKAFKNGFKEFFEFEIADTILWWLDEAFEQEEGVVLFDDETEKDLELQYKHLFETYILKERVQTCEKGKEYKYYSIPESLDFYELVLNMIVKNGEFTVAVSDRSDCSVHITDAISNLAIICILIDFYDIENIIDLLDLKRAYNLTRINKHGKAT